MGPLTTTILANEDVELNREVTPVDAIARITGKNSGWAPAMTALTATCFTVKDQSGKAPGAALNLPTISSGRWLVPLSIASTFSWVGRMMGMKSVIPLSV